MSATIPSPPAERTSFSVLRVTWREYERDYARYFAVAMIYYALISAVPLLLLLMGGLGLLLRLSPVVAATQQTLLVGVEATFGSDVRSTVERLTKTLEQQSSLSLGVSLIGLLLTASVLVRHLQLSFRAIWQYPSILVSGPLIRSMLRMFVQKLLAYVLVIVGGAVLLLTLVLLAGINWLTRRMSSDWMLAIPASVVIIPVMFALLFRYLAPHRLAWRHVWLAAILCSATWLAAAKAMTLSTMFFGKHHGAYGAVGALLTAMVGLNILSQCLFYGAELCKVLARQPRAVIDT